ncbi:hypothetical protein A3A95_02105 [Candidatus Nomurabacteria bacterium RIFCSPLOWO2_01_FULL_39_18]|uniref:Pilus assembly protein PilO n=1 Tax=Candidatus Nomurabacteria bacterium RIFCSPHIGHO2_01_FULL_40_24b TaxID=1801739 RepID=A0A1F6V9G2_9BACT|nr:MAG: hypothetical protein A2647_00610 [Candidatus Nomurabacteria bacterium RIFCSPHIGHO2_01_FULL_40_24b]OGI90657.1 MAG: hypothetical protein A3A95_02105 [Candidatus Nomurabacteria bacterium RIFCSPLOWO2_01_FULL_39_18]
MIRYVLAAILIGISVVGFFMFTDPLYKQIEELNMQATAYNEALDNSKALENERDKLTAKYNTISPENLLKIKKLLPDNIDNIRLILEIEQVALPYGMVLRDVRYDTLKKNTSTTGDAAITQGSTGSGDQFKDYGSWDLEFSTTGTYNNFINFMKDLESNLRIVDISSIRFSSGSDIRNVLALPGPEVYKFDFKIKTYWLKN